VHRRVVLHEVARDYGAAPESVLIRWLVTAAPHVLPIVGTTRAARMAITMADAQNVELDPAVSDLVNRLSEGTRSGRLGALLLPDRPPIW